jgi:hypothetical protein
MESITNTNISSGTIQLREGTTAIQEAHITNENSTWQNHNILIMRNCSAGDEISCYSAGSINWYGNYFGQFGGYLIG